jgi:hypothetical protein
MGDGVEISEERADRREVLEEGLAERPVVILVLKDDNEHPLKPEAGRAASRRSHPPWHQRQTRRHSAREEEGRERKRAQNLREPIPGMRHFLPQRG